MDGSLVPFQMLRASESWVASGRHGDVWLQLAVHDLEPDELDLVEIEDPLRLWRERHH